MIVCGGAAGDTGSIEEIISCVTSFATVLVWLAASHAERMTLLANSINCIGIHIRRTATRASVVEIEESFWTGQTCILSFVGTCCTSHITWLAIKHSMHIWVWKSCEWTTSHASMVVIILIAATGFTPFNICFEKAFRATIQTDIIMNHLRRSAWVASRIWILSKGYNKLKIES